MYHLQLRKRGGRAAIGRAGFHHHVGDGSCWPVRGEGAGLSKEGGASYLQALLRWLHVAVQLNQRGADQSSSHRLQLPADLLWGKVINERAEGEETRLISVRLHAAQTSHSSSQPYFWTWPGDCFSLGILKVPCSCCASLSPLPTNSYITPISQNMQVFRAFAGTTAPDHTYMMVGTCNTTANQTMMDIHLPQAAKSCSLHCQPSSAASGFSFAVRLWLC